MAWSCTTFLKLTAASCRMCANRYTITRAMQLCSRICVQRTTVNKQMKSPLDLNGFPRVDITSTSATAVRTEPKCSCFARPCIKVELRLPLTMFFPAMFRRCGCELFRDGAFFDVAALVTISTCCRERWGEHLRLGNVGRRASWTDKRQSRSGTTIENSRALEGVQG